MSALIFLILILAVVPDIESYLNHGRYNGSTTTINSMSTESAREKTVHKAEHRKRSSSQAMDKRHLSGALARMDIIRKCRKHHEPCRGNYYCCSGLKCRINGVNTDTCIYANETCIPFNRICMKEDRCCDGAKCIFHDSPFGKCPFPDIRRKCRNHHEYCSGEDHCCPGLECGRYGIMTNTCINANKTCISYNRICMKEDRCCDGTECIFHDSPFGKCLFPGIRLECSGHHEYCGGDDYCCPGLICGRKGMKSNTCITEDETCIPYNRTCMKGDYCCGREKCEFKNSPFGKCLETESFSCTGHHEYCGDNMYCCPGLVCGHYGIMTNTCLYVNEKCLQYNYTCMKEDHCCGRAKCLFGENMWFGKCLNVDGCTERHKQCNDTKRCCEGLHCINSKCDFSSTSNQTRWPCIVVRPGHLKSYLCDLGPIK